MGLLSQRDMVGRRASTLRLRLGLRGIVLGLRRGVHIHRLRVELLRWHHGGVQPVVRLRISVVVWRRKMASKLLELWILVLRHEHVSNSVLSRDVIM